mmetsp:Transcript_17972/g.71971  ORF Transcript_17972/g.71971 Transcript_17972/m.71971 type:complete len:250 (+) Transcript_17972:792-1541(+)
MSSDFTTRYLRTRSETCTTSSASDSATPFPTPSSGNASAASLISDVPSASENADDSVILRSTDITRDTVAISADLLAFKASCSRGMTIISGSVLATEKALKRVLLVSSKLHTIGPRSLSLHTPTASNSIRNGTRTRSSPGVSLRLELPISANTFRCGPSHSVPHSSTKTLRATSGIKSVTSLLDDGFEVESVLSICKALFILVLRDDSSSSWIAPSLCFVPFEASIISFAMNCSRRGWALIMERNSLTS